MLWLTYVVYYLKKYFCKHTSDLSTYVQMMKILCNQNNFAFSDHNPQNYTKKKNIEMFWLNYKLPNWLFPFHNLLPNINILGTFTSSINLAKTNKCSNSSCPFYISTSFTGAQTQMQLFLNDSEANTINMTRLWTQECYLKTYVF